MKTSLSLCVGLLLCLASLSAVPTAAAQTGQVAGTVTDDATGEPLPGVNVVLEGTQLGTATAPDGTYEITGVEAGTYTLRASFVGYGEETEENVEVQSGSTTTVDIVMQQEAAGLDEVVVVGYGTQQRSDLTGSISSVSASDLEDLEATSVNEALQGQVAGVQVSNSGAPGGGVSVRIRGSNSITGGNEPLYVIDDFPIYSNSDIDPGGGSAISPNPLAFLDPSSIESIEVLKGPSATAIYGSRGANGVVLITTRQGRAGETAVNFESTIGVQEATNTIDVANAEQYALYANEWFENTGREAPFGDPASFGGGTDWQEQVYGRGLTMNYRLGIAGGTDETQYSVSGSYSDEEGVVENTNFDRYSIRTRLSHQVSDKLDIGSSLIASRNTNSLGQTVGTGRSAGGAPISSLLMWPILPVRAQDGTYALIDEDYPTGLAPVTGGGLPNPVASTREIDDAYSQNRVLGNVYAEYEFLEGLSYRVRAGVDLADVNRQTYYTSQSTSGMRAGGGLAQTGSNRQISYLLDNIVNYQATLGEVHGIDATGGFSVQTQSLEGENISNANFPNDITGYDDIGAGTQPGGPTVGSYREEWGLTSFLGRLNYTFDDRYLLTLTGRFDGSSKFGEGNRWGFFPLGALAWRVSNESFMEGVDVISNLKLRGSYGLVGSQEIGAYASLPQLSLANYNFNNDLVSGYFPSELGNRNLKWETTRQLDLGVDLSFFEERFTVTADYYHKATEDLLLFVGLPFESGFDSVLQNLGQINNQGVELALGADVFLEPGFTWNTSLNLSRNRNEVIEIGDVNRLFGESVNTEIQLTGNLVQEGEPLGAFWGWETDGVFNDQQEIDRYTTVVDGEEVQVQPDALPGERKYVDVDGDGTITAEDRTTLGSPYPDLSFGWTNSFGYGNFGLSVFVQGGIGQEVLNANLIELVRSEPLPAANTLAERWEDRWTPDNPDAEWPRVGKIPGTGSQIPQAQGAVESWMVEDASFARLQNVTLRYSVPLQVLNLEGQGVSSAQMFVGVQNLYTLTGYSGVNPDVNTQGQGNINRGIDLSAYPVPRTYRVGLRLGF